MNEIVGVFREPCEEGLSCYSFRTITKKEYNMVKKRDHSSSDCFPEATFWVSSTPFTGAEKVKWRLTQGQIIYEDRIVINEEMASEIIPDVVGDMLVEEAIGKEVDVLRIKIEKDSPVSTSIQECGFQIIGMDGHHIYFEVNVPKEAALRESETNWNSENERLEVDQQKESALRRKELGETFKEELINSNSELCHGENHIESITIDISPFLPLFFKS